MQVKTLKKLRNGVIAGYSGERNHQTSDQSGKGYFNNEKRQKMFFVSIDKEVLKNMASKIRDILDLPKDM